MLLLLFFFVFCLFVLFLFVCLFVCFLLFFFVLFFFLISEEFPTVPKNGFELAMVKESSVFESFGVLL